MPFLFIVFLSLFIPFLHCIIVILVIFKTVRTFKIPSDLQWRILIYHNHFDLIKCLPTMVDIDYFIEKHVPNPSCKNPKFSPTNKPILRQELIWPFCCYHFAYVSDKSFIILQRNLYLSEVVNGQKIFHKSKKSSSLHEIYCSIFRSREEI